MHGSAQFERFVICAAAVLALLPTSARAQTTTTTSSGSDTAASLQLSTGGIDDKTYIAAATNYLNGARGSLKAILDALGRGETGDRIKYNYVGEYDLPRELVTLTPFARAGEGGPAFGLSTLYDHTKSGAEIGFFGAFGAVRATGVTAKWQLPLGRQRSISDVRAATEVAHDWLPRVSGTYAALAAAQSKHRTSPGDLQASQEYDALLAAYKVTVSSALAALTDPDDTALKSTYRALTGLRAALFAGYREAGSVGLANVGISASQLLRLGAAPKVRGSAPPGLLLLANLQLEDITSSWSGARSAGQWGIAVALQDQYPAIVDNGEYVQISRWRQQLGVEYVHHNALAPDDAIAGFVRLRFERTVEQAPTTSDFIAHSWEVGLVGGVDAARKAFGLVKVTKTL